MSVRCLLSDPFKVSVCARSNYRIRWSCTSTPRPSATCAAGRSCRAPMWCPPRTASLVSAAQSPPAQCTRVASTCMEAMRSLHRWCEYSFWPVPLLLVQSVNYSVRVSCALRSPAGQLLDPPAVLKEDNVQRPRDHYTRLALHTQLESGDDAARLVLRQLQQRLLVHCVRMGRNDFWYAFRWCFKCVANRTC